MTNELAETTVQRDEWKRIAEDRGIELERLRADISQSRAAIEQLHAAVKTAQELAATRLMEIERLRAECDRLLKRGDKAELELSSLKHYYTLAARNTSEPLPCAPDPRDAVIAELTKWADDWAVYRGPAEKPVDKGWRLAAEELQSILKKSATRTSE